MASAPGTAGFVSTQPPQLLRPCGRQGALGSARSTFLAGGTSFRDGRVGERGSRRICVLNATRAMGSSSQGTFLYRTFFIARPAIRIRHRSLDGQQFVRRNSSSSRSMLARVSNNFAHSNHSDWGIAELEFDDRLTRAAGRHHSLDTRPGHRVSATALNQVFSPEQVQLPSNTFNTTLHQMGLAPSTWSVPSRTVRVALHAVSKARVQSAGLPQYSKRVARLTAGQMRVPDASVVFSPTTGPEAWERAAQKLGIPVTKSTSAVAYKTTQVSLSEVEPFRLPESKPEVFKVASPRRQPEPEPEPLIPEKPKAKKAPVRKKTTVKKAAAADEETKPKKTRAKKIKPAAVQAEAIALDDVPVASLASSTEDVVEERESFANESVMVINSVETATAICEQLMGEYKDFVHACDTEVAEIDVKNESPVGHGRITCFSIYCGPSADFGEGKNRLWVDVLDGGEDVLQVFKRYFEDPSIKKVWHNYSFDKHILSRHGIQADGFYADTMHLARLYDSARRGAKGGYSLEVLSADEKVMDSYERHLSEADDPILAGKKSMKELFGRANLKKDGTPGKIKTIPPVDELQRGEQWRDAWIHYSTFDAVCTWRLWQALHQKLKSTPWNVPDLRKKGTMYDFYEKYWRPFGEVLVNMEADGMLVDCDHLASVEKVARQQQQISISRFRKWAAKYCPDAVLMNVGSDAQIRQLLFGGTSNRKDSSAQLPMERVFSVPNDDGFIEEGKKIAKKTKPIVIKGLANWGIRIPVETYTSSGWPAVGGAAIKALAGKVAIDYTDLEADSEDGMLDDIEESGGLLTSAGVEQADQEEDSSVYGKAYEAFGKGKDGKEACMALAALCEVASINTLLSNFIEPLQGNDIKSTSDGWVHCSLNINTETGRLSARRPSLQATLDEQNDSSFKEISNWVRNRQFCDAQQQMYRSTPTAPLDSLEPETSTCATHVVGSFNKQLHTALLFLGHVPWAVSTSQISLLRQFTAYCDSSCKFSLR